MSADDATRLELLALGSEELRHLADAAWLAERRVAELRTAALAGLWWGPALGAYRKNHHPPPYPADAPPLPPRLSRGDLGHDNCAQSTERVGRPA
jgi:hypothetical protein